MSKARIFWTTDEINLMADRVIAMQDVAAAEGGKPPSLCGLCRLAQTEVLPKKRQRNFVVTPPAIADAIEAKRNDVASQERASEPAKPRRRRMAAIKTDTHISQTLDGFSDKQLTEELGRRLVRRAVRRYVMEAK